MVSFAIEPTPTSTAQAPTQTPPAIASAPAPVEPATMGAMRFFTRWISLISYGNIFMLFYDLFTRGIRLKSFYLFFAVAWAVFGVYVGWKKSDKWVRAWFYISLAFFAILVLLPLVWHAAHDAIDYYPYEQMVHIGSFIALIAVGLAELFVPHEMINLKKREDEEENGNGL